MTQDYSDIFTVNSLLVMELHPKGLFSSHVLEKKLNIIISGAKQFPIFFCN